MPSQQAEAQAFEAQPYYIELNDSILDRRIVNAVGEVALARVTDGNSRVQQREELEYGGRDGEDYSGFIAMHALRTASGQELAIIRSLQFNHDSGLPPHHHSWSAEFDDVRVAKDFWGQHWEPRFDGMDFVEKAKGYLKGHPKAKGTIRVQELGLLTPWYDGGRPFLEKFSAHGNELVGVPTKHAMDERLSVGQVYKRPVDYAVGEYAVGTCLAAFMVRGQRRGFTRFSDPDRVYVQWSDGTLVGYTEEALEEGRGPVALTAKDLVGHLSE